jgi:flagellar hook-associated protein 3 FlgL
MRVSQSLLLQRANRDLDLQSRRLLELQKQASSAKRVMRPSDDPLATIKIMESKGTIRRIDNSLRSGKYVQAWYNVTDSTLQEIEQSIVRAKEIALSQANSTASTATRSISVKEVKVIYDQIVQLANTRIGDRYIFGGSKTHTVPVDREDDYTPIYQGNDQEMSVRINGEQTLAINVTALEVLSDNGVLEAIQDLIDGLEGDDQPTIAGTLDTLGQAAEGLNTSLAKVGSRATALENQTNLMTMSRLDIQETLSEYEDADIAKVFTELTTQQMVYEAALRSTATTFNSASLMNFI